MMRTYTRKRPHNQLIENVQELCRLCLCKAEGLVPIFTDTNSTCAALALRIMICVGLEIKREDCLPNGICSECIKNLDKYYTFRKKCEVSYQKLKSHVLAMKEHQCKLELQRQNEIAHNKNIQMIDAEDDMTFVVTFDKDQLAQVSMTKIKDDMRNELQNVTNPNNVKGSQPHSSQEQEQEHISSEPDISTFLMTVLLQLGIMREQENGSMLVEQNIKTLDVETGDSSQITFELTEENDPQPVPVLEESIVTEQSVEPTEEVKNTDQNDIFMKYVTANIIDRRAARKYPTSKKTDARCDECGRQLASRSALQRHRRIHSGEKPYACEHCGRRFTQKEVLMRHILVHEEQRPYSCGACAKSFTQRSALVAHERAHAAPHARALALHRCAHCPKVFLYASGLSRHMLLHLGRMYVCGACERQFRDKSSLLRHFKTANHSARVTPTTPAVTPTTPTTPVTPPT